MGTFIQYIFYLAVLIRLAIPLGKYISKAMSGEKVFLSKILAPCERGIYKILHTQTSHLNKCLCTLKIQ